MIRYPGFHCATNYHVLLANCLCIYLRLLPVALPSILPTIFAITTPSKMWWVYRLIIGLVGVLYIDHLSEHPILFQTTVRSSAANPPRHTPPVHPPILETSSRTRKTSSSKAILDNVLFDPPVDTINISLDNSSSIYTAPDATYFCTGMEAEEHKHYGWAPRYGVLFVNWFFAHWLSCVVVALLLLILRKARPTTALLWTQEQKHRRDLHQLQQEVVALILSKEQECNSTIAEQGVRHDREVFEQGLRHNQEIDGLKASHSQASSEVEEKVKCRTARLDSKVQQLEEQIVYKDHAHRHKQELATDNYMQKLRDIKETHADELDRLGQLPEHHTEKLKEDHTSELQHVTQLYEQKLSQKDTQLQDVESNHKKSIEAKEKEIKQEVDKVKAAETKLDTVTKENDHRINGLEEELQQSAVIIQDCRTTALENTTVIDSQQHEILGLKSTIETYGIEKSNAGTQIHCLKLKEIRQKREIDNLETKCKSRLPKIQALEGDVQQKDVQIADLMKDRDYFKNDRDTLYGKCKRRNTKIRTLEGEAQQKDVEIAKLKADHESSEQKKDEIIGKLNTDCKNLKIRATGHKESAVEAEEALDLAMAQHEKEIKALEDQIKEQNKRHEAKLAELKRNSRPSGNSVSPRSGGSQQKTVTTPHNTNTTISRSSLSQVVSQEAAAVQAPEQGDAAAPGSTVQPTTIPQPTVETPQQQQVPPTRAGQGASLATGPVQVRPTGPRHQQKAPDSLRRQLQDKQQKQAQQVRTPIGTNVEASRSVAGQRSINNDNHIDQGEKDLRREQEKPVARKLFEKTTQQGPSTSTRIGQGINKNNDTESKNEVQSATPKQLPSPSFLDSVLQSRITAPYVTQTQNETGVAEEKNIDKAKQEKQAATQLPVQEPAEQTFEELN